MILYLLNKFNENYCEKKRYATFDQDDKLPEWFLEDEEKNCKRMPNIPYNIVAKYKKKYEDIDARPIKKVVEAQARKKRRVSCLFC